MESSSTERKPLVEPAPDEAVTAALAQSAYPAEFIESNQAAEEIVESEA
jgi:hypothetical protein